jgi:hypothetical protein
MADCLFCPGKVRGCYKTAFTLGDDGKLMGLSFVHISKTQFDAVNAFMEDHLKACLRSHIMDPNGVPADQLDDEAIDKSTAFNLLWTSPVQQAFAALDLPCYVNFIDSRAHAAALVTGHMPEPLEDMRLLIKLQYKDGEWQPYWVQEEVLTAGKKGGPTKVLQCEPVVMGTIGYKVCWAKPVLNGIGVFLTWSLKYGASATQKASAPLRPESVTRSPTSCCGCSRGPGRTSMLAGIENGRFRSPLEVLFEERYPTISAKKAAARAERLIHDFLFEKEGLDPIKDLPGIIRSMEHLSLYLEGAKVHDMPASEALGRFIYAHFQVMCGGQANGGVTLRHILNQVINVLG